VNREDPAVPVPLAAWDGSTLQAFTKMLLRPQDDKQGDLRSKLAPYLCTAPNAIYSRNEGMKVI
jgi:hypothetical protein